MNNNIADKLANDHWEYVKTLSLDCLKSNELHYKSALIHGYKHGFEDGVKYALENQLTKPIN